MGKSDLEKKKKEIRDDCKQSAQTSGTTPSGSTGVPSLKKKAHQEGLLGGGNLPGSRRGKVLNFGGQTQELALEVSGRLVLGFRNTSGGVGGRPHRRRVGGARVRLSEPIYSREWTGHRLAHEGSGDRRSNSGIGPNDNRGNNIGGLVGGGGRRLHRPGRRSRNNNSYPSWKSYGWSVSLLIQVCGRHIRVCDPRRVDEVRFGSRDGWRSVHVGRARRRSVRLHLSGVGGGFLPLRALGLQGSSVSGSLSDERSGRSIGSGGWYSRSGGWDHSGGSGVGGTGSPTDHKTKKKKRSGKIKKKIKEKKKPAARGRG